MPHLVLFHPRSRSRAGPFAQASERQGLAAVVAVVAARVWASAGCPDSPGRRVWRALHLLECQDFHRLADVLHREVARVAVLLSVDQAVCRHPEDWVDALRPEAEWVAYLRREVARVVVHLVEAADSLGAAGTRVGTEAVADNMVADSPGNIPVDAHASKDFRNKRFCASRSRRRANAYPSHIPSRSSCYSLARRQRHRRQTQ